MMKDHASNITGDGVSSSRLSQRAKQSVQSKKGTSKQQPTGGGQSDTSPMKWLIPRYPDTWKKSFGGALFKLLLDWRTDAHKGKSQFQLWSEYETTVERVQPPRSSSRGQPSRAAAPVVDSNSTTTTATTTLLSTTESGDQQGGENTPARKRIRLQKSRRVITEQSA